MIDGWKADKKRQRGQHVYRTLVCLSPEPRSQKTIRTKRALPTGREKEEEGRERERREEENELKTVEGGQVKAYIDVAWKKKEQEVKEGRERERHADLYWTCEFNWAEHKIPITCQIITCLRVCVGWMDMCVGGCVPCVVLCGLIYNVMRTMMCGLELKGHNTR